MSVDFQIVDGYTKCVVVEFTNGDDGVYAQAVKTLYAEVSTHPLGTPSASSRDDVRIRRIRAERRAVQRPKGVLERRRKQDRFHAQSHRCDDAATVAYEYVGQDARRHIAAGDGG